MSQPNPFFELITILSKAQNDGITRWSFSPKFSREHLASPLGTYDPNICWLKESQIEFKSLRETAFHNSQNRYRQADELKGECDVFWLERDPNFSFEDLWLRYDQCLSEFENSFVSFKCFLPAYACWEGEDPAHFGSSLDSDEKEKFERLEIESHKLMVKLKRYGRHFAKHPQQPAGDGLQHDHSEPSVRARSRSVKKESSDSERSRVKPKMIAALNKHHKYSKGICRNLEPIGGNECAELAKVSKGGASGFFNKHFGGHQGYVTVCNNDAIGYKLQFLNVELPQKTLENLLESVADRRSHSLDEE